MRVAARVWEPIRSRFAGPERRDAHRGAFPRFALAFLIAAAFGTAHLISPGSDLLPVADDSAKYHHLAQSVARLVTEPDLRGALLRGELEAAERDSLGIDSWEFQHAPAYILPLGLLAAVLPNDVGAGRAFGLLLYAAGAGLLVLLGRRLLGRLLPWVALAGYLLYLPIAYYGLAIATEPHATFSVLLAAWLLVRYHRRPRTSRGLLAGLGLALLFLAKTTFRALAVGILLVELALLLGQRRPARLAAMAGGALLPVVLWGAILLLIGAPMNPVAQTGEQALWLYRGNYVPDQGWETVGLGDALGPELQEAGYAVAARHPGISETEHKRRMYTRAFRLTLAHHPVEWVLLVWKKFALFWQAPPLKIYLGTCLGAWAIPWWFHRLLFPLGLLGVAVAARRRPQLWLPALIALGVSAVHACSHLVARYQLPVLPVWFLYGLLGLKSLTVTLRRAVRPTTRRPGLPWVYPAVAAGSAVLGALLRDPPLALPVSTLRTLYGLGVLLGALAVLALAPFLAACSRQVRHAPRAILLWIAPLLYAIGWTGVALSERDWDRFPVRLAQGGDAVIQRIAVPWGELSARGGIDSAWVEVDMLRSPRGTIHCDLLVQGEPVHSFVDTLGGRYEAFLFDSVAHGSQGRYRRVADLYARFAARYLAPRYGAESIGYDYFRRWVKVGVPLSLLHADTVKVELRMRAAGGGGWIELSADRCGVTGAPRWWIGPVIGENPFEHSSYRAEYFAADRRRMDARLVRSQRLRSSSSRSLRRARSGAPAAQGDGARWVTDLDPGWRVRSGELRIRLRLRLRGEMIIREQDGESRHIWVTQRREGDRPLEPVEMRMFQWWRDEYFDGTWIY